MRKQIQRLLLAFAGTLFTVSSYAYDVKVDGIYYNLDTENKTASVTNNKGLSLGYTNEYTGAVSIPSSIAYYLSDVPYAVTSIEGGAFKNSPNLTSVTIPNSVTTIGSSAFLSCTGLTSVTIGNSIEEIGIGVFEGCSSLISVIIPNSVTSIGRGAFSSCTSLSTVAIPNSVTTIGNSAFASCKNLTSITIPNSVTNIGDDTFNGCTSLTDVIIPESIITIGDRAYGWCSNLNSITIPNSVTSIGNEAFRACTGLTSVIIPSSVMRIGDKVFYDCISLTDIIIPESVTTIGDYAFSGCKSLTTVAIHRPSASIEYVESKGRMVLAATSTDDPTVISIGYGAFSGCALTLYLFAKLSDYSNAFYGLNTSSVVYAYASEVESIRSVWKGTVIAIEDSDLTGIDSVETEATTPVAVGYYDLKGWHLSAPAKGLNIIRNSDGKTLKVIVK